MCWKADITLPTKVHIVKAMVFPVVTYGWESWTIKKAERQRIDAFELWCWRRLLKVPWTARKLNQSVLMEINPEHSLEGLKLKLQYFWSSDVNRWLIGKVSDAGKDWGQKKRVSEDGMVGWHHGFNGHKLGKIQEMVKDLACCSPWGHKESDITGWHNNNTHTYTYIHFYFSNFCQCIYVYVYIYFLYFFVNVVMVGNYTWKKI